VMTINPNSVRMTLLSVDDMLLTRLFNVTLS
jgi:hypothetical protein